jgi:tetratricopeptide (TPR) repeat protein
MKDPCDDPISRRPVLRFRSAPGGAGVGSARRWFASILTVMLALAVTACGSGKGGTAEQALSPEDKAMEAGHEGGHTPLGDLSKVGTVEFPTSCDPDVQGEFKRAVALLHSFFYEEARRVFTSVLDRDPGCGIAHWGVAMTWYHPVWSPPTEQEFRAGTAAIEQAKRVGAKTQLERDYTAALATFFCTPDTTRPEACPPAHAERARRYTDAMRQLFASYPTEHEVAAFYGLALLGSATPADLTYQNQREAGKVLEQVWRVNREHPGVTHYLIHAFDYPSLAEQGLPAAKAYAGIAPQVPHALHMPSHTFVRRGLWDDAIRANLASAEAARAYEAKYHPGAASFEELHALDYLVYAYLQTAQFREAQAIADRVSAMEKTHPEFDFAVSYAMGAIPARLVLERQEWDKAAALPIPPRPFWAQFPFAEAHLEFARALGRTRVGDFPGARRSIERLAQLRDAVTNPRFEYFRQHIDVQTQAASGWLAISDGERSAGLRRLREAADLEDALGKHPVTPGSVLPVRELLGHALVDAGRPDEALTAFEASLDLNPGRFAAVHAAGRAAEKAGRDEIAAGYYRQLLSLASSVDPALDPSLAHARAFLDGAGRRRQ